jgi:hypothetical protein
MQHAFHLKASLIVAAMLTLPMAQADNLSKDEYKSGKTRISADYKAGKTLCDAKADNAKDVCVEEAKAKEKVALAELEYAHTGKATDQNKVLVTKAETAYQVAKEKCDDKSGNDKDVCVKEAKAVQTKALAEAKVGMKVGDVKRDATAEVRDADYKVAVEKCDAMSGDAKASCVNSAKAKFGKS